MEQIARDQKAITPGQLHRLSRQMLRMGAHMAKKQRISEERWQTMAQIIAQTDEIALEESLSPYHSLLEEKAFYRLSAPTTRRMLRKNAAAFAKRHRLPPASAVLLWQGEAISTARSHALWLLIPIPITVGTAILLFRFYAWQTALCALPALPAVCLGTYLLSATLLNRLIPSSPLPLLSSGEGHPTLVVGVGKLQNSAQALQGMERILCAGNSDCRYLLLLYHADALLPHCAGEEEQEQTIRRSLSELEHNYDVTIQFLLLPRSYNARRKKWEGEPTLARIAPYLSEHLTPSDEAVCILPTDATILPGTIERLCAALFHPLFTGNSLTFLYPNRSPLPLDRLAKLRRVLLQKMSAPADFNGYGMIRREFFCQSQQTATLSFEMLHPQLSTETLYCKHPPLPLWDAPPHSPRFFPTIATVAAVCHPLCLWAITEAALPPLPLLGLWALSLADLWVALLLSLPRKEQGQFFFSPSALKRLGKEMLARLVFPMGAANDRLGGKKVSLAVLTFLFGCAVIAAGAPLSFLGIGWMFAPLLLPSPSAPPTLSPMEKAACHALAKEIFENYPIEMDTLPPTCISQDSQGTSTTPLTIGYYACGLLSAFSLGLCDHHTFQRQIASLLNRLEKLPHQCGLLYAQYSIGDEDEYEDSRIDSYECGIYALCMAQLEAGLWEYANRYPQWETLAKRVRHISARMDFQMLLTKDGSLCRSLTPSGEQSGELSALCEKGGIALFAALSSDSLLSAKPPLSTGYQKKIAFAKLQSPRWSDCKKSLSPAEFRDFLSPLLLLPVPRGSQLDHGADTAIRHIPRSKDSMLKSLLQIGRNRISLGWSWEKSPNVSVSPSPPFRSLLKWPHLGKGSLTRQSPAPASGNTCLSGVDYCLLLQKKPHYALAHLQMLQHTTPMGGFGGGESGQGLSTDDLALALIALESAIRPMGFAARIQTLPRCACLTPLLDTYTPPTPPRIVPRLSVSPPTVPRSSMNSPEALEPSLLLAGDAQHGLLVSKWNTFTVWENRHAVTISQEVDHGFAGGRPTGILLRRGQECAPLSYEISADSHSAQILLNAEGVTAQISSVSKFVWRWQFQQSPPFSTEVRWILCPSCKPSQPVRLTTVTDSAKGRLRLVIESSASIAIVMEATGLSDAFTHADPSPLPKGEGQCSSIFHLQGQTASGICSTPTCIIGGRWAGAVLTLSLATASTASEALLRLDAIAEETPTPSFSSAKSVLPTPESGKALDCLALSYYLSALFKGDPLPKLSAIGNPALARSLERSAWQLCRLDFPIAPTLSTPLLFHRREGAEGMLRRLMTSPPLYGETPLLPLHSQTDYSNGYFHQIRGRNLPFPTHTYAGDSLCLYVTPSALRLTSPSFQTALSIALRLEQGDHCHLLPEACTEIRYLPGKAFFQGEGFCLTAALLPDVPLLLLELCAGGSAELVISPLSAPDQSEDGTDFWHLSKDEMLFTASWSDAHRKLWLIGSFPRQQDRLYYQMRETVTPHTYQNLLRAHCDYMQTASETLLMQATEMDSAEVPPPQPIPSLSAIALAVLSSPSPVKALLSPLCTPRQAQKDLLALAAAPASLLLPTALLCYGAIFSDALEICQTPISTPHGQESLYLHAARLVEDVMENAPETPLLPALVSAFAKLSHALGDPTAPLYAAFTPPADFPYPSVGKDPYWNCARTTVLCLAALEEGSSDAVEDLWESIRRQLPQPSWEDAALLWSGVLWTVLGFRPQENGKDATFAPMTVKNPCTARLVYGKEYQIPLSAFQTVSQAEDDTVPVPKKFTAKA